jgi:hypothetical protein
MSRIVTLKTANFETLTDNHLKFAHLISRMAGSEVKPVAVSDLQEKCHTLKPKRFRSILRELRAAKIVSIKAVKA